MLEAQKIEVVKQAILAATPGISYTRRNAEKLAVIAVQALTKADVDARNRLSDQNV
jgi:hypothetical protein